MFCRAYKRDDRCLFLYVHSDDFQMFFGNSGWKSKFMDLVLSMAEGMNNFISELEAESGAGPVCFEYDLDARGNRVLLGEGTYGKVRLYF